MKNPRADSEQSERRGWIKIYVRACSEKCYTCGRNQSVMGHQCPRAEHLAIPYCPYTDTNPDDDKSTPDHIVPLSLGGLNSFVVSSETIFNSTSGSKIEGPIVNDLLFAFARRDKNARGHTNKPPVPTWKNSKLGGEPVQVAFGDVIKVWDSKKRAQLKPDEVEGREFISELKIDPFAATKLAAKIAIGASYFVGGKALLNAINVDGLRWLATADLAAVRAAGPSAVPPHAEGLSVMDRFHPDISPEGSMFRYLTEFTGRTTIILQPYHHHLAVHVGLLGMFLATVIAEADHAKLETTFSCDLGRVMLLAPGQLEQLELRSFLMAALEQLRPDEPTGQS